MGSPDAAYLSRSGVISEDFDYEVSICVQIGRCQKSIDTCVKRENVDR